MAATEGSAAFGITCSYAATSGGTPTPLTDLVDITPVGESVETVEMTHHASPNGYSEHLPTIKNAEGFEATFNYVDGAGENRALLRAVLGVRKFWLVTFASGAKVEIDGFLSEVTFDSMGPKDKRVIKIKVTRASAAPTWTEAP